MNNNVFFRCFQRASKSFDMSTYKKKIFIIIVSCIIFCGAFFFYIDAKSFITPQTVKVQGYFRGDGTYVRPHKRRPPYSIPRDRPYGKVMSNSLVVMFFCCIVVARQVYLITRKPPPPYLLVEKNNETLVKNAIENKLLIGFDYLDNKGNHSKRVVRPESITLSFYSKKCMKGYCFLRKSERHFALFKMNNVTIIDKKL